MIILSMEVANMKRLELKARPTITVRSGLLTPNQLKEIGRLQRGIKIEYLTDSNKWQTVSIKNGSFTILEEEKKMHEISFRY